MKSSGRQVWLQKSIISYISMKIWYILKGLFSREQSYKLVLIFGVFQYIWYGFIIFWYKFSIIWYGFELHLQRGTIFVPSACIRVRKKFEEV